MGTRISSKGEEEENSFSEKQGKTLCPTADTVGTYRDAFVCGTDTAFIFTVSEQLVTFNMFILKPAPAPRSRIVL